MATKPTTTGSVAPPVINAPETVSASTIPIPGCSVTDPYAATAGGTMALNLSCQHGEVQAGGKSGRKIQINAPLTGVNEALATLTYVPPSPPVADTISINVWNQAGQESTKTITVSANGAVVPGPEPEPKPPEPGPTPGTGTQARRVADLIECFGVNTFSSLDDSNIWGSWPANYSPESTIAALRYIVGDSGFAFRIREYHYAARYEMQRQWLPQIVAAFPGTRVALCPGANANPGDVPTMMQLANDPANGVAWIEGLNEPNTDFGSGQVPYETTQAIQDACWDHNERIAVLGPSIVAGTPHPEGWITGYCGAGMDAINAAHLHGNGHYYPPGSPDVPGTGYSVAEYIEGLQIAYDGHPAHLTEFHPTLYNSQGNKPDEPGWSGERDAYYTLTTLLRCAKLGVQGLWWYALFDYGTTYYCGLFPKHGADDPRPAADALRALCTICTDKGDRNGFAPGKLDITIDGLSEAMDYDVFQASDGRFLVPVWHAAAEVSHGVAVQILLSFGTAKAALTLYNPLDGAGAVSTLSNAMEMAIELPPGVVVVEITP